MTRLLSCVVTRSLCLQEGLLVLTLSHRPAPTSFFPTSCHVPSLSLSHCLSFAPPAEPGSGCPHVAFPP